ncbi:Myb-binding protein 1A [Mactra antiquata]
MGTVNETKLKLEASKRVERLAKVAFNEQNKATSELIEYVKSQQGHQPQISTTTAHIVKKFIQGLSAIKGNKRVVFSASLCQLLKKFECIETSFVCSCIEENYASTFQVVDNVSRDIARIVGWMTLVKAQRWPSLSLEYRNQMLRNLIHCKPYVQVLSTTAMMEIIQQAPCDDFKQAILPHLMKQFNIGWENCTPDRLTLLLVANKHHSSAMVQIVKKHWQKDQEDLVSEQNYPMIADILGKCSTCNNGMHPLVDMVLSRVTENSLDAVNFWKNVGIPIVTSKIGRSKAGKLLLGLNILQQILPHINTTDMMSAVLDQELSSFISACCALNIDKDTKKSILTLVGKITQFAVENEEVQLEVIKCLVNSAQSSLFNNEFNLFLKQTSSTVQSEYMDEILKTLVGHPSWITSNSDRPVGVIKQWCSKQVNYLFSTVDSTCCLSILQFTFLHSFFNIKQKSKKIPHCIVLSSELEHHERKMLSDTCFKLISKLLTRQDIGVPKLRNMNEHLDVLYQLAVYVGKLLESTKYVELVKSDVSEQIVKEWKKLSETILSIHTKKSLDEITDSHAFELLFICCGLQLFTDTDNVQETLQDLYVCYKKSTKKRKSAASLDEAAWIDVIVEMLLSMVFNDNFLSRVIAKQVMTYLTDHLTSTSIQLLIDALKQTRSNESKMVGVGDDDDDDDDEMNSDDENGAMEVDEEDEEEDDDDSDDDDDNDDDNDDSGIEEEADLDIPEMLKQKVKAALGDAAGASDDDDDDDDDNDKDEESDVEFSDSEMMKLDDVLASAFKSMRKGKKTEKQQEQQLISFKTRVLDLVEAVVKGCPTNVTCTSFIMPLLDLIVQGMKKDSDMVLGNKAENVLNSLCKQKQMNVDSSLDKDSLFELCEKLMDYTRQIPIPSFVQTVGKACLYVLKIIMSEDILSPRRSRSKPSKKAKKTEDYKQKVVTMVKTAVINLLEHKRGHCKPAFFHILLTNHPALYWELNEPCMKTLCDSDAKVYLRTQAAAFLGDIVTKETGERIGKEEWDQFTVKCKTAIHNLIKNITSEKLNKSLVNELVSLGYSIQSLYPGVKILEDEDLTILLGVRSKIDKSARKIINKLSTHLERPPNEQSKKQKRKQKDNDDENEEPSPKKKVKTGNQPEKMTVNQSSKADDKSQSVSEEKSPLSNKEKKKRNKKNKKNQPEKMTVNQSSKSIGKNQSVSEERSSLSNKEKKKKKKKNKKDHSKKEKILSA